MSRISSSRPRLWIAFWLAALAAGACLPTRGWAASSRGGDEAQSARASDDAAADVVEPVGEASEEAEDASQPEAPLPRPRSQGGKTSSRRIQSTAPQDEAQPARESEAIDEDDPAAQEETPESPEQVLQRAFGLSKKARTRDEVSAIIALCEPAAATIRSRSKEGQPSPWDQYGSQLLSWAHNRRGELLAEEGLNDQALADFETSLKYDKTRWKAYHNRAVSEAIAGQAEKALADFEKTIELQPRYANAFFNRGELLYDEGRFQDAVDDYSRAIRLSPRDSGAYNSRGHAYYRLNDYQRAINDYTRAIQIDGENAAAYVNRGDAYGDLGDYGRAASDYRNAIRIAPSLGRAYQSAAWLMSTCPEPRYRNPQFALESAKKAIQLDGENYRYLDTLAAAQANSGDFDSARETLAKAIEQAPAETAEIYKARLAKYEAGEAFRESPPDRRRVAAAGAPRGSRSRGRSTRGGQNRQ